MQQNISSSVTVIGGGQPQNCDFAARRYLLCRILYHLNEAEVKV